MLTLKTTGMAVTAVMWMSGTCIADEASVRAHLDSAGSTSYLQQGESRLELIEPGKGFPSSALVFKKFIGDLPLHGARVVVIENADGSVAQVFDDSTKQLQLRQAPARVSQAEAIDFADWSLPESIGSVAEQVWFRIGNEAVRAWEVTTTLKDLGLPASPTHFEMVIDAETGEVLSQRQIDTKTYAPGSIETEEGVFPRIVINNAIGAQGSRDYADPFDAVVRVGGCTGTLIAPNVVLAARHCGIGSGTLVRFGDNSNSAIFTVTVQSSILPAGNGSLLDGGDVSIHILNSSVPANIAQPMRLIDETDALEGMVCATIGYGYNGLGSSGHGFSADGFRWGGENIIDRYGSPSASSGSNIISTDFDNGTGGANTIPTSSSTPLEFEATTAPGDSGGPVLVQFGSEWVIAGVLSGGTTSTSVYGDISWWTGTAIYRRRHRIQRRRLRHRARDPLARRAAFAPLFVRRRHHQCQHRALARGPRCQRQRHPPCRHGLGVPAGPAHGQLGDELHRHLPAPADCPSNVEYYISFDLQSGTTVTSPAGGASHPYSSLAAGPDRFRLICTTSKPPVGFSAGAPGDNATTGVWVRVNPVGTAAQPEDDTRPPGPSRGSPGREPSAVGSATTMSTAAPPRS